jgi:hypothetical protein
MWTLICLTPAALLLVHQIRKAAQAPKQPQPTLADIPVIVLVGNDLEAEL